MNNIIYRVFDKKNKYQQSYSSKLKDAYSWAVICADLTNGTVHKDTLSEKGLTKSSSVVYPLKDNGN